VQGERCILPILPNKIVFKCSIRTLYVKYRQAHFERLARLFVNVALRYGYLVHDFSKYGIISHRKNSMNWYAFAALPVAACQHPLDCCYNHLYPQQ